MDVTLAPTSGVAHGRACLSIPTCQLKEHRGTLSWQWTHPSNGKYLSSLVAWKTTLKTLNGSTKITLDKIKGASSYLFEYATAPLTAATNWIVKVGTTRTFIDEGLTSGQQYVYRVAGIGADPTIVYSDVVSKFVQ